MAFIPTPISIVHRNFNTIVTRSTTPTALWRSAFVQTPSIQCSNQFQWRLTNRTAKDCLVWTPCTMNISTNDFRGGTSIEMEGTPYRVVEFLHVKPGKGAAFVRTKLKNLKTGNSLDKTFRAGEVVQQALLEKSSMQHTYIDGDEYVFMDLESFEEDRLTAGVLGENVLKFLTVGLEVEVLKHNEDIIDIILPKSLTFVITQTEPGAKGNSASGNVLKPAIIETGAEVMVPLFINIGESVKINTEDGKYLGRSKD